MSASRPHLCDAVLTEREFSAFSVSVTVHGAVQGQKLLDKLLRVGHFDPKADRQVALTIMTFSLS